MTNTALNTTYNSLLNIMDKHRGRLHEIKLGAELFDKVLENMHVDQVLMYNWKNLNPKLKLRKASRKDLVSVTNYKMVFVDEVETPYAEEVVKFDVSTPVVEIVNVGDSVKIVQSGNTILKRDKRHLLGKKGTVTAETADGSFVVSFNDGSGIYTIPKRNVVSMTSVEMSVVKVKETRAVKAGFNKGYHAIANLNKTEHAVKEFLLKNPEYTGVEFVERYFLAKI